MDADWAPDPQDVANLLRARTKDDDSRELGTWTARTRPTEHEVIGLIETAVGDLLTAVPMLRPDWEDPDGAANSLCGYRAAMLIELSYFPEQVSSDQSAYREYRQAWDDGVAALRSKLAGPPSGATTYSVQMLPATTALAEHRPWWVLNLPEPETTEPIVRMPEDPPGGKVVVGGSPPGEW